jgi:hypothetical protein
LYQDITKLVSGPWVSSECDMGKPWKTILRFAFLGLTLAAACYLYSVIFAYTLAMNALTTVLTIISVVLCPPQLLFATCIDCSALGREGFIMWAIIGIGNTLLYAVLGGAVVVMRMGTKSPGSEDQPDANTSRS